MRLRSGCSPPVVFFLERCKFLDIRAGHEIAAGTGNYHGFDGGSAIYFIESFHNPAPHCFAECVHGRVGN